MTDSYFDPYDIHNYVGPQNLYYIKKKIKK